MGQKPYLVLEIDSHTADAGLDTRVEAFLDIVESYRRHMSPVAEKPFQRRYHVALKEEFCDIVDRKTGKRLDIRDRRVHLVWPSMGDLSTEAMNVAARRQGIHSTHLPLPDVLQHAARAQRRLGQGVHPGAPGAGLDPAVLPRQHSELRRGHLPGLRALDAGAVPDRPVPRLLRPALRGDGLGERGPARGQLGELLSRAGRDLQPGCLARAVLGDYFTDIRNALRLLARDPAGALALFAVRVAGRDARLRRRARRSSTGSSGGRRSVSAAVPRKGRLEDVKKVLVVGEIYVRRDNFSVEELLGDAHREGDLPEGHRRHRVVPLHRFRAQVHHGGAPRREGWLRTLRDGGLKDEAVYLVEKIWKQSVEERSLPR